MLEVGVSIYDLPDMTEQRMQFRWRRGLLRLWAVLAIGWLVLPSIALYQHGGLHLLNRSFVIDIHGYQGEFSGNDDNLGMIRRIAEIIERQRLEQLRRCEAVKQRPYFHNGQLDIQEALKDASEGKYRTSNKFETDCYWWREIPENTKIAAEKFVFSNNSPIPSPIGPAWLDFALYGLVPPLVLLAFGFLLGWIVKGFLPQP